MKIRTLGIVSALAMVLSSATVWSLTGPRSAPRPEAAAAHGTAEPTAEPSAQVSAPSAPGEHASFEIGKTLVLAGRLGNALLPADRNADSYLFVDVKADRAQAAEPARLALAIAIDKSGSMAGKRLRNAIEAARGAVARLRDGDVASVVTYNDRAELLVPATVIDARARADIERKLAGIPAMGETCISCGIDTAMAELRDRDDAVKRILVLSDGEPTVGLKEPRDFERQAQRARDMGCAINAIGVDVDYNARVMSAIARGSNGRHTFVDNPSQLGAVFEEQERSLARTIATGADLRIELLPGVDAVQVFDRAFHREGNALVVPLGSFSAGEDKTVLVKVRVHGQPGEKAVADVRLSFRDLVASNAGVEEGHLAVELSRDGHSSPLDPLVAGRVDRVETASALVEANDRFAQGDVAGAQRLIEGRRAKVESELAVNERHAAPAAKPQVVADFSNQREALDKAAEGFAAAPPAGPAGAPNAAQPPPPATTRAGKRAIKQNAQIADDLAL